MASGAWSTKERESSRRGAPRGIACVCGVGYLPSLLRLHSFTLAAAASAGAQALSSLSPWGCCCTVLPGCLGDLLHCAHSWADPCRCPRAMGDDCWGRKLPPSCLGTEDPWPPRVPDHWTTVPVVITRSIMSPQIGFSFPVCSLWLSGMTSQTKRLASKHLS